MEGFLPLHWSVFWTIVCIPVLIFGIRSMKKLFSEHPEKKLSVALSGAFIVILSSLKIPSVTGSSSHPTGTGMCVMFSGPAVTAVICTIVLLFQGTFMAHGGFTTIGANVFSMGIAGPFAAYSVYKFLNKRKINPTATVFATVFVADIATYLVTALQLSLVVLTEASGTSFLDTYSTFFGIFALTQVPIAIAEGALMVFFFRYLSGVRPELVKDMGYDGTAAGRSDIFDSAAKAKKSGNRNMLILFSITLTVMVLVVCVTTFFYDIGGADDAGAGAIEILVPGYEQWSDNFMQIGEFGISILFLIQTAIGVLILASALYLLIRKKHDHGNEFSTVDVFAYGSRMVGWSPLAKLLLVVSLLIINIASPSIWMAVFTGAIGFILLLYGSSLRPPAIMRRLFIYAQVLIIISVLIFAVVTDGETVMRISVFGFAIDFSDAGVSLALLIYARATASLLIMFAFAASTPVPHLSAALRKLRFPGVFVEMMVLIYRYTFLLMESAEKMHTAAECRLGYSSYRKSMRTTSRLSVGVFTRSLDTAERGQITLQCRNYKGEFPCLSDFETRSILPTILCAAAVIAALVFLLYTLEVFSL
jgi:cobalamin biosynthesis protein CbiM/cobalt ECF transporter T component CbiQ